MNIAIDAFPLVERNPTGISVYLKNTMSGLLRIHGGNSFFVYSKMPAGFDPGHECLFTRSGGVTDKFINSYENTLWLFSKGVRMMKNDRIDVFWGTRHMLPPFLPKGIRKVLTVHDLAWHYCPETMGWYNLLVMRALAKSEKRAMYQLPRPFKSTFIVYRIYPNCL